MEKGKYGEHRVLQPSNGCLPQAAWKIDNTPEILSNEILIDADILNITSTAFNALKRRNNGDKERIKAEILAIVAERGKFQCPDTGSGGMLVGRIEKIGEDLLGKVDLVEGETIATMVSLTLTPLFLQEITEIDVDTDQVFVKGKAILFESGIYAKMSPHLSKALCLAAMDVAGAPGWTAKYVHAGDKVVVIGTGKAGLLCLHEAKKRAGNTGLVIAIDSSEAQCQLVRDAGVADHVLCMNAQDNLAVMREVDRLTNGTLADFVVNTVNTDSTEMSSILSCKDHGKALFFSMSTVFSKVALGCEGVGKEMTLLVGTGYTKGHAEIVYQILLENDVIRSYFERVYGG
ncbi:zinc-binding dehydrogenase [Ruminococcaceae bacterium OttesenSCG-928-A16]|nr:zinc-binding dehydrogenase [Ruminococcaceae bacterium OttesenSCG-928-A16]